MQRISPQLEIANPVNDCGPHIAVMQGRMVPAESGVRLFPATRWRDEFRLAAQAGFNSIEWIYDAHGEKENPLATDAGIAEMMRLSRDSGVTVRSLCANIFMDRPFLRAPAKDTAAWPLRMEWLLSRCKAAGIRHVVVPLLDECAITTEAEASQAAAMVRDFLTPAEINGIELHLETSLAPKPFAAFLAACAPTTHPAHRLPRVTYDCGNSAALGYNVAEELAAYGARIGSVHIKDRVRGGGSVLPGTGDVDWTAVFRVLATIDYRGDFVLEVARPNAGGELERMTHCREWAADQIEISRFEVFRREFETFRRVAQ